ncbi:MarR family transcriptional regulator [Plantibacter flavus]|uniref:MarR family winged helix-turn-helix transcriptional regulator n=1 Tax=Plantibacter flavus TaxID=150123 RepID=UPI003F172242
MTQPQERAGYWYGAEQAAPSALLDLLRQYREAEQGMRRRTRVSMNMGETDLAAVRHLLAAQRHHHEMTAGELADRLQISTASTTALIDRLVRRGHAKREQHPGDRRSTRVVPTIATDDDVRATLGSMHRGIIAVAESMTPEEASAVSRFLTGMIEAVSAVEPSGSTSRGADASEATSSGGV